MARNRSPSGRYRLAIGISLIWLALLYFFTEQQHTVRLFLLLGLLPVMIGWTVYWVRQGYRQDQSRKKRFWPWRR
jgi:cadmium resistance protein CadD (predicted permease)